MSAAKKTMADFSAPDFVKLCEKEIPEVLKKARDVGIDVAPISVYIRKQYGNKSFAVGVSFFRSAIYKEIANKDSEAIQGIIAGVKDRYESPLPARFMLVRSSGEHVEASSFDVKLDHKGVREEVKLPCIATLKAKFNEKYNNYNITSLGDSKPLTASEFAGKVGAIAKDPEQFSLDDQYTVVVVKGEIARITPAARFENKEKVGDYRAIELNALGRPNIVLQIHLKRSGNSNPTVARLIFERCKHAVTNVMVDDIWDLAEDAVTKYVNDPEGQTGYLQSGLRGRQIFAVGVVSRYSQVDSEEYGTTYFVDISCAAIVDAPSTDVDDAPPLAPVVSSSIPEKKFPVEKKTKKVDIIADMIFDYTDALGIAPNEINADDVKNKVIAGQDEFSKVPKSILENAIMLAQARFDG